jgi:hypothetical protein
MTQKPCTHEYLAANESSKILMCRECGVVYLHMQNMTLRFGMEQFSEFAAAITEASKKLGTEASETPRRPPVLNLVH